MTAWRGWEVGSFRKKDCKNQKWWMTFQETVFSIHNRAGAHTNSQRLWKHAEDLHKLEADKFQHLEEKVLPIAKKLFRVASFSESSSMKYHWAYQPDFKAVPMIRSSWVAQIKLHSCLKRKRIWSLLGREDGRVWKEVGEDKEYNKNILKFLKSK